jgi:molybdopterin molybdotransferase
VREALGEVAAESVRSPSAVPARPSAAMDGYALGPARRGARTRYRWVSPRRSRPLGRGEATDIVTGAPLPSGAVAVARKEGARKFGELLRLVQPVRAGRDVHAPGASIPAHATLVRRGGRIDAYAQAALLAAGVRTVAVRPLRVRVISVGSELRAEARGRDPRVDSLGPWVVAVAGRWADARHDGIVPDDPRAIRRAIERAARRADLVVTIGGSSVGPRDFTKRVVASCGAIVFGGTRINVLKRAGLGRVRGTPVLILPGQVESAVVGFHEHGLALLSRLLAEPLATHEAARLARGFRVNHRMDSTVLFETGPRGAIPLGWGVARYTALLRADAFGYFSRGSFHRRGERVRLQRLIRGLPRGLHRGPGPRPERR